MCVQGGPKLRKWYGAPDLLPKDGSVVEDEDEDPAGNSNMAIHGCSVCVWFMLPFMSLKDFCTRHFEMHKMKKSETQY